MNLKMIEKALQSNKTVPFKTFQYYLNEYSDIYKGLKPEDSWVFVETENGIAGWNENAYKVTFNE